ncbi:MAG: galactosylceramidase [Gammaproteobacteria bacterium]|nr:galactosylceramidase [Gammaproteobacteria bacterium]
MSILLSLLAASPAAGAGGQPATVRVSIDPAGAGKVYDGIGATSTGIIRLLYDYPEPQRSEILDYLFKPDFGASLQQLKVEIGSDGNSNAGSEPSSMHTAVDGNYRRGVGWWLMKEARRRNPALKLSVLAWNFPGWVKQADSQATVDYLIKYLQGAKRVHGLDIDYIGIWNETRMNPEFIKRLRRALTANHLKTRIVADDLVNTWDIVAAMEKDPALRTAVDVIGTHYPRFVSPELVRRKSLEWHKPIWSTEDGPWNDEWGASGMQSRPYAEVLNRNYIQGRLTSTNIWALVTAAPDTLGLPHAGLLVADSPWSGHYTLKSPLWIVAQTTQFAQPGWKYIDGASGLLPRGGSYVTLHDSTDFSVIVETLAASSAQRIDFTSAGMLDHGAVHVWRTTPKRWFEEVGLVTPVKGRFPYLFEPNSVYTLTTTTGQRKGGADPPPPARPFPIPYQEGFEEYPIGSTTPRFLLEQNGSYEVAACTSGRPGHCLRQVVRQVPVAWGYWGDSTLEGAPILFGDRRWRDYRVSASVLLEEPGYVTLLGRVWRADCDGTLHGYQFRLYDTGRWELDGEVKNALIASGQATPPGLNRWHRLELTFRGERIAGRIDGAQVFALEDPRHAVGMAGFGTGWNAGSFDDVSVTPVSRNIPVISQPPIAPVSGPPETAPELLVPVPADHAVRIGWNAVAGASGYRVRIGTRPDAFEDTEDAGDALTYNFKTLKNGTKYYFEVAAVNAKGRGQWSAAQYATPGSQ